MTVNGLIPAESMGITLPHEHLLIVHKYNYLDLTDETTAINELNYFANAGGKTLFEASSIGIGRNPEGLKRISTATGVNVVMSAGYYKDQWIPDSIKYKSVEQLTQTIIHDIINGINGIHAGFIKVAVSRPITQFEENALRAAARAQIATGAAVEVHFDGDLAPVNEKHHVLNIFENEGVDLSRVILNHAVPYTELVNDFISLLQRGCNLAFDMQGTEVRIAFLGEQKLAETLTALFNAGFINQLLMSQDVCFSVCYVKNGGFGYAHILNNIVPQLKVKGITNEQINTLMIDNPKRIFPFKSHSNPGQCLNTTYTPTSGIVTDNSGNLDYQNNMTCTKLIQPSNCSSIALHFTAFDTEQEHDVLSVYDGATTSSPLLGQFSGSELPPVLASTGSSMLIVFSTNENITSSGWSANYYGTLKASYTGPCVNETILSANGTISDNSGSSNYLNNMACLKLVEVPNSTGITMQFSSFRTQQSNDIVTIYDGATTFSPLLGQYSGTSLPPVITSTGGSMLIAFVTNRSTNEAGWNAQYSSKTISITPMTSSTGPASGTQTLAVASNTDWLVNENSSWLTATKTNATTLTLSYDKNDNIHSRFSEISVSGPGITAQHVILIQDGAAPILNINPGTKTLNYLPGSTTFFIESNTNWSVDNCPDWLSATKTNDTTLTVFCNENTSINTRTAGISLTGEGMISQNITINQSGSNPFIKVNPESDSVSSAAGIRTFNISSNIDWSVNDSSVWLTAIKTNDTTITVSYGENTRIDSRSAEISINDGDSVYQNVIITQNGADPRLILIPEMQLVEAGSGTTVFIVRSNIDWSLSRNLEWLDVIKLNDSTISVTYDDNTSADPRSGNIIVSGAGVPPLQIEISQRGAEPTLYIEPASRSVNSGSGTTSFEITSNTNWSVDESSDWLTATKKDENTLIVSYDENAHEDPRYTNITISGAGVFSRLVTIIQQGAITSGVISLPENGPIKVYPNPVVSKAMIFYPKGKIALIEIYDPFGRLLTAIKSPDDAMTEIDFSDYNSGLYFYRLIDHEGHAHNGRILKK